MSEIEVGQILADTYKIVSRLGQGGMGAVFEAEHLRTQKRVALKVLHARMGHSKEVTQRFEREARATSFLDHPGIVKVDDFGPLDDGMFLVMELLPGPSLREAIDAGLGRERAFVLIRQLLEALGHAHALGVIHRDLKPDNIKLVPDRDGGRERVKVLDFGIARVVGEAQEQLEDHAQLTEIGMAFGTPDYISPEQALGQPADGRADLYAVGVILFEALAGRKPFVGEDAISVARQHVAADPPTLAEVAPERDLSPLSEALVAKALKKRPSERFADAAEMMAAIDDAAAAEGFVLARDVSYTPLPRLATPTPIAVPVAPPRPMPRWGRWAIAGGAALVVAVGLAIGISGGGGTRANLPAVAHVALPSVPDLPPVPSKLASDALGLLDRGELDAALIVLDEGLARDPRDATAQLALGHVKLAGKRPVEAVAAYERAVTQVPLLADDERLGKALAELLAGKDETLANAALELAARGKRARRLVVETAGGGKSYALRARARKLAERLGVADGIDRYAAAVADLQQAPSCPERKAAVATLRQLGDARAVPELKKARRRTSGFFGTGRPNACLAEDAAAAIAALERQ